MSDKVIDSQYVKEYVVKAARLQEHCRYRLLYEHFL